MKHVFYLFLCLLLLPREVLSMRSLEGPSPAKKAKISSSSISEIEEWIEAACIAYNTAEQAENFEEKEKFYKQAFALYQKAADQEDAQAQFYIGLMYKEGKGIQKSDEEAFRWYKKAANQGNITAQFKLGVLYDDGEGVKKSDEKAFKWTQKAAERGYVKAQFNLGVMYKQGEGVKKSKELGFQWTKRAAKRGHADAQYNLGFIYDKGQGVKKSTKRAFKWYKKGAEKGSLEAQVNLALMYEAGRGVTQSYPDAFMWMHKAAEQEDIDSQVNLGIMYKDGRGVEQSDVEALKWYRKAVEKGDAQAQVSLGLMYEEGRGVEQSDTEALKWYKEAAQQADAQAQFNLGVMCEEGRECVEQSDVEAFKWYEKAAKQELVAAQVNLGVMYEEGRGVEQSDVKAFKWYEKAAKRGDSDAQCNLGLMYLRGQGIRQSVEKAFEWYEQAAEQGHPQAQYNLGLMYGEGQGVEQSYEESLRWYKEAAAQGETQAPYNLGLMYDKGEGVEQSDEEAFKWYKEAAEQGEAQAQVNIGIMYAEGKSVKQSHEKAFKWYKEAADQGHAIAQCNLGIMYEAGRCVDQSDEEAFKWYKHAAEQGDAQAQYNLGIMYDEGRWAEQSDTESLKWIKKAAEQGNAQAYFHLSLFYDKKKGVEKSEIEPLEWFLKGIQKEADQGNRESQFYLGSMYAEGHGVKQSAEKSYELYCKAAKGGNAPAMCGLAINYFMGNGTLKDEAKALTWFQKAALKISIPEGLLHIEPSSSIKNICSDIELIKKLKEEQKEKKVEIESNVFNHIFLTLPYLKKLIDSSSQGDPQKIARNYQTLAEQGDTNAQFNLGLLYHFGIGIRQDLANAFEWYEESSQRENEEANDLLGKLRECFTPSFVKETFSLSLVKRSPETTDQDIFGELKVSPYIVRGDPKALYQLGRMYLYGWGTEKDQVKAIECFQKAIEKKRYAPALKALADVYSLAGETHPAEVIRLYRRAAKQGDTGATAAIKEIASDYVAEAIYALGKAYEKGWGIGKNEDEASYFYDLAVCTRHPKAQYVLAIRNLKADSSLDLLSQAAGAEEWKAYLKAKGKKYTPKNLAEIEKNGAGYYRAQQALGNLYTQERIISFNTFDSRLSAYAHAVRLHKKAFERGGKHLDLVICHEVNSKYNNLKESQEKKRFNFQEDMKRVFEFFPSIQGKEAQYDPSFLHQIDYVIQKTQKKVKKQSAKKFMKCLRF